MNPGRWLMNWRCGDHQQRGRAVRRGTSSGIRHKFIPGARMVMIVTRKLSAVAIEEAPANCTPRSRNDWPKRRAGRERSEDPSRRHQRPLLGAREAADEEQPSDRQHPEAESCMQAWECHIRSAHHQRSTSRRILAKELGSLNMKIISTACVVEKGC